MKRQAPRWSLYTIIGLLVAIGALGFLARHEIREIAYRVTAPPLPDEEAYSAPPEGGVVQERVEGLAGGDQPDAESLPSEKRLAVPFTSQAPHGNWDYPYQEACEEASLLMVAMYYEGRSGVIPPNEADAELLEIVDQEVEELGFYKDTTMEETAQIIEKRYPELRAEVVPFEDADQLKTLITQGIPVIIPASGKMLPNPNFRNGGPLYHVLVVRGYTETYFITNDPGTRLGENFLYTYDALTNAIHDWNDGDVNNGAKVILVVRPR